MAFSDFKYPDLLQAFKLSETGIADLFGKVSSVAAGGTALTALTLGRKLALTINSEKARSEWLIAPILGEFWDRYGGRISLFSGVEFNADPESGLTGFCDFLIGRTPQLPRIHAPVAIIFEAKRDNIMDGLGQCIAGMVGIQRFNKREGTPVDPVYGCVTTGANWKFLKLAGSAVTIDSMEYGVAQVDKLLGIFTYMIGPVSEPAAA
jgi:hypothetical protein